MLTPAELKVCVTWFIYFLDSPWVRYNSAKFCHFTICVTDFREGGQKVPPPIHEQPRKSPSWIGLKASFLTIKLLEKPNKDKRYVSDWRTFYLLNLDQKIISKALVVKNILPVLISPGQTVYVIWRFKDESTRLSLVW